jgi:nucleotide-binding universal stress UspA family protein
LRSALAVVVRRLLVTEPQARLACVNVQRISRITIDSDVDAQGRNLHLQRLIALKHWARTLPAAADRITYHVIEGADTADALVDYARNNRIDHIVIGARSSSPLRRLLGSVSAKVVAEAPCTVTVVRTRESLSEAAAS